MALVLGCGVLDYHIADSTAGFSFENTRALDVSFVWVGRLPRSPCGYTTLPPELMVEVKSPSDRIEELRDKIDEFVVGEAMEQCHRG